jgi:hypothetical protein
MKTERPEAPSKQPETTPQPAKDDAAADPQRPVPDGQAIAEIGDDVGGPA